MSLAPEMTSFSWGCFWVTEGGTGVGTEGSGGEAGGVSSCLGSVMVMVNVSATTPV